MNKLQVRIRQPHSLAYIKELIPLNKKKIVLVFYNSVSSVSTDLYIPTNTCQL